MSNKKFILNADDFGMSKQHNKAVLNGYNDGFLTSASICANGKEYNSAINEILPECPNLGIGVHLNIIEGNALIKKSTLTDSKGKFNKSFLQILIKSGDKKFLEDVEKEFRAQIEKVQKRTKVDHLDSHVHVHAIPDIFKITARLAKEYDIPYVRTQYEDIYFVPNLLKHLNLQYFSNVFKVILLNSFTKKNKPVLKQMGLRTNNFLLGVGYSGLMDESTVEYGLISVNEDSDKKKITVEALIHPCAFSDNRNNLFTKEYKLTKSKLLEDKIKRLGFDITNYKQI